MVDTEKPMTVVTQFITDDGTDNGDLVEIRRLYLQDGDIIENSFSNLDGNMKSQSWVNLKKCFQVLIEPTPSHKSSVTRLRLCLEMLMIMPRREV